jgi:hypothetical protein
MAAEWVGRGRPAAEYAVATKAPMLNGACLLINPSAMQEVGLWDEAYFIYYDDMDWTLRASRAGWSLWYEPAVGLYHLGSFTMKKHSHFSEYCLTRGRTIFMRRHGAWLRWPGFLAGMLLTLIKPTLAALFRGKLPRRTLLRLRAYWEGLFMTLPAVPVPRGRS